MDYDILNHSKFLLIYHIVLVTKYRKRILDSLNIPEIMKTIESVSDFIILEQEFEPDHIHLMIKHQPKYSPSSLIRRIKMMSTMIAWKSNTSFLSGYYWRKRKSLWSSGFFVCTIGNASIETIRKYIREQPLESRSSQQLKPAGFSD
jgi:putative transposase